MNAGLAFPTGCAAARRGRPLAPTAELAVGDVLTVDGERFTLHDVYSCGGRGPDRYRLYRFRDRRGNFIPIHENFNRRTS